MDAQDQYVRNVNVSPVVPSRLRELLDGRAWEQLQQAIERSHCILEGRVIWHVNSTAAGCGVAEMLRSLLAYARGAAVDARWVVISGSPGFFQVTKRLGNMLRGSAGDGGKLADFERSVYESTIQRNAVQLAAMVQPQDVVVLHDPQTAGLVGPLKETGAVIVWRSHVGAEERNEHVERGWDFLLPYLLPADASIFSQCDYVPPEIQGEIISPSIDPFSPKNQEMERAVVRAILSHVGLVVGKRSAATVPAFQRHDGSPGRVDRRCDVLRTGPPPDFDTPLVVQVSRWDRLKDPMGVMRGFVEHVDSTGAHLILAGPGVHSVADDPEGAAVLDEIVAVWRTLPHALRSQVHLACLPMKDIEENAAIVNALQRHAAVVTLKSLQEGFGLTVTEAMWKGCAVVASGVGGIREQIKDGVSGILLPDPSDLKFFGEAVRRVLIDAELSRRLGEQARLRVREHFLHSRHLIQYVTLLERLIGKSLVKETLAETIDSQEVFRL